MKKSINRRDFLKFVGGSALALCGLVGAGELLQYMTYPGEPDGTTEYDLGPATDYPPGSRTQIPEANVLLLHDQNGFRAISLTCSHLGCTVKPTENGFACPCHNSQFDPNGNVVHGPAAKPLQVFTIKQGPKGALILIKS